MRSPRNYVSWAALAALTLALGLPLSARAEPITITLQPGPEGKDALVYHEDGGGPDGTNYGDSGRLGVRADWYKSRTKHSYVQFDLPSLAPEDILAVRLSLLSTDFYTWATSGNRDIGLYRVTGNWAEDAVKYNNQPTYNPTLVATITVPSTISEAEAAAGGVWHIWDSEDPGNSGLLDLVTEWLAGTTPNHGLMVRFTDPNSTTYRPMHNYRSSDYTGGDIDRPKLEITVIPEPGSVCLLLSGAGAVGVLWLRRRRRVSHKTAHTRGPA